MYIIPEFLPVCFYGMMIYTLGMSWVLGIGWLRMQMALMTLPTYLTLFLSPHLMA
jgi:hypothetical protein